MTLNYQARQHKTALLQNKRYQLYFVSITMKLSVNELFCFRLFYAGAVEGQMPEILSMIQVNKMTPAPAVLVVVI